MAYNNVGVLLQLQPVAVGFIANNLRRVVMQVFSYRPRSGSRVIAACPATGVLIVEHPWLGSWVVGRCFRFTWEAAEAGRWWRHTANRLAKEVVWDLGGMAEDDRGTITLVVPLEKAEKAYRVVCQLGATTNEEQDKFLGDMWHAGVRVLRSGRIARRERPRLPKFDDGGMLGFDPVTGIPGGRFFVGPVAYKDGLALQVGLEDPTTEEAVVVFGDVTVKGDISGLKVNDAGSFAAINQHQWSERTFDGKLIWRASEVRVDDRGCTIREHVC